jgi:uncharacterized protein
MQGAVQAAPFFYPMIDEHREVESNAKPRRFAPMTTVLLLLIANIFMTVAWYGHLKFRTLPLVVVIFASWGIALAEYCFQVPANRLGYGAFTLTQLKIMQECITLVVFTVFALLVFREPLKWNYAVSYVLIVGAVYFAFKP